MSETSRQKAYRERHPDRVRARLKKYRTENADKIAAVRAIYREAHREELAAKRKADYEANTLKRRSSSRRWRLANPTWAARLRFEAKLKSYGITPEEFAWAEYHQRGLCAICDRQLGPGHGTHIDHNHRTGKFRALLCIHCNRLLGGADDSPRLLQRAIAYLELHA